MSGLKNALVLGASGGMGYSVVKELSKRGVSVKAFARNEKKIKHLFQDERRVSIVPGDIFQRDMLREAAKDVDIIFHAANLPFSQWEEKLLLMIETITETVQEMNTRLAVVDNIYAYGKAGNNVKETREKVPCTKKGRIRLGAEKVIKKSGVLFLIAHFPDFYGPYAENTILNVTLQNVVRNKNAFYVGQQTIPREFIYTPDGAEALVHLAFTEEAYGEHWNIPGAGLITGEEIVALLKEIENYQKRVFTVTRKMMQFLGLFQPEMREAAEMYYLNETPVTLSGEKYEKRIGPLPRTSYREGLKQTLRVLKEKKHSFSY